MSFSSMYVTKDFFLIMQGNNFRQFKILNINLICFIKSLKYKRYGLCRKRCFLWFKQAFHVLIKYFYYVIKPFKYHFCSDFRFKISGIIKSKIMADGSESNEFNASRNFQTSVSAYILIFARRYESILKKIIQKNPLKLMFSEHI